MSNCQQVDPLTAVDLGEVTIEVTFLRGMVDGQGGWWCIRKGIDFAYQDLSFFEGRDHPRAGTQLTALPTEKNAASAVHLSFRDDTGEGLSCPEATRENVKVVGRMGRDGIVFQVIARRTRTVRTALVAGSEARH